MTQAQKIAKDKFKKAIEYRKKTGVSLKEAFAHIYGKKVGAVKNKYTQKQLEKIADDYAYITEGDVDKITYRLLDKDYTDKLLPIYLDKIAEYNKKNKKVGSVKKKAAPKKKIGNTSGILIQFNPRLKTWAVYENGEYQGNWKTLKNAKDWVKAYFGQEANKIDKTAYMSKTKKVGAVKKKTALKKKAAPKKKSAPKKVASKRITDIHKDSKSHNVNIKVVSGINDDILKELKSIQQREIYFTNLLEKQLFEEAALKSQTKGKSAGIAKAQLIATRRYIKDLKNILMRLKKQKMALKKDIK